MVGPDGSVYMQVESSQYLVTAGPENCFIGQTSTYTESVQLMKLTPGSSPTYTTLNSYSNTSSPPVSEPSLPSNNAGDTIPDGQGGVLAMWAENSPSTATTMLADINSLGSIATTSSSFSGFGCCSDNNLVLGDNNTAFITDGTNVASVNTLTLGQNWTYASTGGTLSFDSATPGGTVSINDHSQGAIQLDSSGSPSTPQLALQGALPYDLGTWQAISGGELAMLLQPDGSGGLSGQKPASPSPSQRINPQGNGGPPLCQIKDKICALAPIVQIFGTSPLTAVQDREIDYSVFNVNTTGLALTGAPSGNRITLVEKPSISGALVCTLNHPANVNCTEITTYPDSYSQTPANVRLSVRQSWYVNNQQVQVFWPTVYSDGTVRWHGSPTVAKLGVPPPNQIESQTVSIVNDSSGAVNAPIYPNLTDEGHHFTCAGCAMKMKVIDPAKGTAP